MVASAKQGSHQRENVPPAARRGADAESARRTRPAVHLRKEVGDAQAPAAFRRAGGVMASASASRSADGLMTILLS